MTWDQLLDFVCSNRQWIVPLLVAAFGASIASGWSDKFPPWLAHLVHAVSGNWGDIARAVASSNPPPSATGNTSK